MLSTCSEELSSVRSKIRQESLILTCIIWPEFDKTSFHILADGGHVGVEEGITTEAAAGAGGQDPF